MMKWIQYLIACGIVILLWSCQEKQDTARNEANNQVDQTYTDDMNLIIDLSVPNDLSIANDMFSHTDMSVQQMSCDPLQSEFCALPWPSDFYLKTNESTGQRAWHFQSDSLPLNQYGVPHHPQSYQRIDGTGLYPVGMAYFPHLDWSQIPNERMIERTLDEASPIALIEVSETGNPTIIPCWGEADGRSAIEQAMLMIRPAQLLKEDTQYIYVVKKLKDTEGDWIKSSPAFASLRDGVGIHLVGDTEIDTKRRTHFEKIFETLTTVGIQRQDLLLAWSFTTATQSSLSGPLIDMRTQAFNYWNDHSVNFTIDRVSAQEDHPWIAFDVTGHLEVPNFMQIDETAPSSVQMTGSYPPRILSRDEADHVQMNGTVHIPFWMRIPHSVVESKESGIIIYGHGMLYSGAEVRAGDKGPVAGQSQMIYMGVDLWGMSEDEVRLIPLILTQADRFPWVGELLLQGVLNTIMLARAAKLGTQDLSIIQELEIQIDPEKMVYAGISQGGIFGASILAASPDMVRGHFGVPGLDYFTLLGRSKNFEGLFDLLQTAYPNPIEQWISLAAIQLIWNYTDPTSFYPHLAVNPLANSPISQVLIAPAQGDHQVAPVTIEVLARSSLGIKVMGPYAKTRSIPLVDETTYPYQGSAIVNWDYQAPFAAVGNRIPDQSTNDPHNQPRNDEAHNRQMIHFWQTGEVIDVCNAQVCGLSE